MVRYTPRVKFPMQTSIDLPKFYNTLSIDAAANVRNRIYKKNVVGHQ